MTLQSVQFGALTPRQEAILAEEMPTWSPSDCPGGRYLPGREILAWMEEEGKRLLGDDPLNADTFSPSEEFMTAERELADEYKDLGGYDDSFRAVKQRASLGSEQKKVAAGAVLNAIRQSEAYVVSDSVIRMLIRAYQS